MKCPICDSDTSEDEIGGMMVSVCSEDGFWVSHQEYNKALEARQRRRKIVQGANRRKINQIKATRDRGTTFIIGDFDLD